MRIPVWRSVAYLISRIFSPLLWMIVLFVALGVNIAIPPIVAVAAGMGLTLIIGFVLWAWATKRISDVDLSIRQERFGLMLLLIGVASVLFVLILQFDDTVLVGYGTALFVWSVLFALITFAWKISGHTAGMSMVFFILNSVYDWRLWWLFVLLLPIAWARVYQRKHTLAQVVAGFALSLGVAGVVFGWFGL